MRAQQSYIRNRPKYIKIDVCLVFSYGNSKIIGSFSIKVTSIDSLKLGGCFWHIFSTTIGTSKGS